jgi:signal transduction histidine kinase
MLNFNIQYLLRNTIRIFKKLFLVFVLLLTWFNGFGFQDEPQFWYDLKTNQSKAVISHLIKIHDLADEMDMLSSKYGADSVMILLEESLDAYIYDESPLLAEKLARDMITFAKRERNPYFTATSYMLLGNVMSNQGRNEEAIALYFDGMKIIEEHPNMQLKLKIQNRLGNLHLNTREYDKAIEYFTVLIESAEKIKNYNYVAIGYLNLANPYMNRNALDTAELYLNKALETSVKSYDPILEAYAWGNLASIYLMRNQYQKAIFYQVKGLEKEQKLNNKLGMIDSHGVLSSCHVALGDRQKAIYHFNQARELAYDIQDINKIMEVYKEGQFIFADLGDYKTSFEFSQKYHSLYDSLLSAEKNQQFAELREKYETAQKEAKITTLEEQKRVQELEIKQQHNQNILLIVAATLLLVIAFSIFTLFVQIRKRKKEVESRNETITKINKALNRSQDDLLLSNKTKDKFFALIAHDLRGPVTSMQGIGRMLSYYTKKGDENRINQLIEQVDQSATSVNHLLDNLLKWALSQTNGLNFHPAIFEIRTLVEECVTIFDEGFKSKEIALAVSIEKDMMVEGDYNMISTVCRNLLSNALKFSPAGGEVSVAVVENTDTVKITVKDSGRGMTDEMLEKIRGNQPLESTRGTQDEKGTGLGLVLCQEFIKKHNSELSIATSSNGTAISFSLQLLQVPERA